MFELIQEKFDVTITDENDILGAWQVIRKLRKNYYVDIGTDNSGTQIQLDSYEQDKWRFGESIREKNFVLAVCRVALLAVEE